MTNAAAESNNGGAKRSIMTLYSGTSDPYSHRVRIVLAEKGVNVDIIELEHDKLPDEVAELNPYHRLPILVDRDLVLHQSDIIMEYLDERFPHPPLMPVYPVMRAQSRLMMYRIEQDWYQLLEKIQAGGKQVDNARKELIDGLSSVMPVFVEMPYFFSEEFSLVDCSMAALLWRLPALGVEWPKQTKATKDYQKRIFDRESFQVSLTEAERELRP